VSRLAPASPSAARARDALTFTAWGGGLSLEAYLHREEALRAHPWVAAVGRRWSWEADDGVLASCETYQVRSAVGARPGHALIVASVFTAPARRGRGHASAMLRALGDEAAREGAQALVLYSEVGTPLYERLGYVPVPSVDWLLPARALAGPRLPPLADPGPGPAPRPGGLQLAREPGQVAWQLERERLQARLLGRALPATTGARLPGASIAWAPAYRAGELHVLWLDATGPGEVARLLEAAQGAAFEAGLATVRHWAAVGSRAPGLEGLRQVPRDGEVPMFRALQPPAARWDGIERASWA
jgi:GNAT superfamily N-acetyltransferase